MWKNIYKKRTAVERVNSRLDVSFGFEEQLYPRIKKDEVSMFGSVVYHACDGIGEDQGEAETAYAKPCEGCVRVLRRIDCSV